MRAIAVQRNHDSQSPERVILSDRGTRSMDMPVTEPHTDTAHTTTKQPVRLSPRRQVILLVVVTGLVGMGVFLGPRALQKSEEASAPVESQATADGGFKATAAQWADLKIEPVRQMEFPQAEDTDGKIANDDDLTTPVFSPYSGRVVKLFARAGDTVHQGDPLFAVQAAEFVQGQSDLISAAATARTARAQLTLTEANEKRQHELFLAHGAAQKDWQQSQVDLANAQGGLNTAQIGLAAVRNRLRILGKTDQEIDAIEQASDVRQLDPIGVVFAPIDGIVVQRQIGLGQNIVSTSSGGSNQQFQIGNLSKVWMLANVREENAPDVHLGDPVEVNVLAYPGRVFAGKITRVSPAIDPVLHRLPVWAEVENPDGVLKPEMFARFRIISGPSNGPSSAVLDKSVVYEGANAHVWLANDAGKTLAIRQIKVGRVTGGIVQVLDGLKPGDKVVTSGAVFIDRAAAGD
jgi:cobalt-zinc-cadmium efflux system membrane fusion protein